jgi:hypothetical protein
VGELLREAVVPELLEGAEAPPARRAGLLDRVAVALVRVGDDRVALDDVGVRNAVEPWTSAQSSMPPFLVQLSSAIPIASPRRSRTGP